MVSHSLIIADAALKDLNNEIIYHRLHTSEIFAARLKKEFMNQVDSICLNPYIYPECRFLPTKTQIYRNIIWGNYLIIYKIKREIVEVLSLFHTRQKPAKIKWMRKRG
jgi:plasmid stabilization system protein ParE